MHYTVRLPGLQVGGAQQSGENYSGLRGPEALAKALQISKRKRDLLLQSQELKAGKEEGAARALQGAAWGTIARGVIGKQTE